MRDPRPAVILGILGILTALVAFTAPASAAVKPRVVLVAPFDAGTLPADDRWIGEGIGQVERRDEHHAGLDRGARRSEEHTSELQSLAYLVCRLLLEKKKKQ